MTDKIFKSIIILLLLYLFLGIFLYFNQRNFIYQPLVADLAPSKWGLDNVELIKVKTSDNIDLNAWYHPAKYNKLTFVYFHGNRGHLGLRAEIIKPYIEQGYGFLLLAYRGYSGNTGTPTENGLYTDGRAAIDYLLARKINSKCIVIFTESLGSGVGVQMAIEYNIGALVMRSAFSSLVDLAQHYYPIFPVNLLLKDRYDSIVKIDQINAPVLFIHGKKDFIVPISMAKNLYHKSTSIKDFVVFEDGSHNYLPDFSTNVIEFLTNNSICPK